MDSVAGGEWTGVVTRAEADKLPMCDGCRNEFYNQSGNSTTGMCWSLPHAQVVTRFRLHWWTAPTVPGAFREIRTLDCHHAPGKYAHYKSLPDFAVNVHRLEAEATNG